ncbi:MAG TPA: hypothetical protein DC054_16800 [Blastocatellia bacterium]|nr:hypothetical protein [Blastocatellia bacterium]
MVNVIGLATPLKLMLIVPHDVRAFASSIAARKVQTLPAVAHEPLPEFASLASPLLFTLKELGHGTGVGVGVVVGVGVGVGLGVGVGVGLGVGVGVGVGVGLGAAQPVQLSLMVPASPPHPSTTIL